MRKALTLALSGLVYGGFALAQSQGVPAPPPPAAPADQITPQVLGEMLKSASTFHNLVQNLNLERTVGPDVHLLGKDGLPHHSVERTATTIGAGAGAGAAIGAMTKSQNGVLIGALIGGASGLIIDEILKHREERREKVAYQAVPEGRQDDPNNIQPRERR